MSPPHMGLLELPSPEDPSIGPGCLQPAHCCRYPVLQLPLLPARTAAARAHRIGARPAGSSFSAAQGPQQGPHPRATGQLRQHPHHHPGPLPWRRSAGRGCSRHAVGDTGHPALSSPQCSWAVLRGPVGGCRPWRSQGGTDRGESSASVLDTGDSTQGLQL